MYRRWSGGIHEHMQKMYVFSTVSGEREATWMAGDHHLAMSVFTAGLLAILRGFSPGQIRCM